MSQRVHPRQQRTQRRQPGTYQIEEPLEQIWNDNAPDVRTPSVGLDRVLAVACDQHNAEPDESCYEIVSGVDYSSPLRSVCGRRLGASRIAALAARTSSRKVRR